MAEVSQSPLLKVTDCCTFAGKETGTLQLVPVALREGKKERKGGERDGKTWGGGRGGGSCQSVSIFTRRSR